MKVAPKRMNKSIRICIGFICLFLSSCTLTDSYKKLSHDEKDITLTTVGDLYQFMSYQQSRVPLVSAHRGGPQSGFPENAIETFEKTAKQQPIIIECDIAITKDSVLVLMHDERLDRTTTGVGFVRDYTYDEVAKLRLKDPDGVTTKFKVPTLADALAWGKNKVIFTLDVKRGVPYEHVIEEIRRQQAETRSILITYSAGQAEKVHKLAPDLMISASIRTKEDLLRLNDRGVPDNRLVAFVGTREADSEIYRILHEHGIMCILGTMGNLDKQAAVRGDVLYYDLIDQGADILSTDRPVEAGLQLKKYREDYRLTSDFIR